MSNAVGAPMREHVDWERLAEFLEDCPREALIEDTEEAGLTDQQMVAGRASRTRHRNLREQPYTREELNLQ